MYCLSGLPFFPSYFYVSECAIHRYFHVYTCIGCVLCKNSTVSEFSLPFIFPQLHLCRGGTVVNLELVNPEIKKKKKKYVNSGVLHFSSVK